MGASSNGLSSAHGVPNYEEKLGDFCCGAQIKLVISYFLRQFMSHLDPEREEDTVE